MSHRRKPRRSEVALAPEKLALLVEYVRGERVILDADLAALYGVHTPRRQAHVH